MLKINVIMYGYNVKNKTYLKEFISSILKQAFKNFGYICKKNSIVFWKNNMHKISILKKDNLLTILENTVV